MHMEYISCYENDGMIIMFSSDMLTRANTSLSSLACMGSIRHADSLYEDIIVISSCRSIR